MNNKLADHSIPRIFLAPASSTASVSVVAMGLLVALRRKGLSVASAKVGATMTQTTQYRRITERYSLTLDPWLLSREQLIASLGQLAAGVNLACVVGETPLFDTHADDSSVASDAELAQLLSLPVILLFDAKGYRDSVRALIHGYATYHPELKIAGVIAENIENPEHDAVLRKAIETLDGGPLYLGGIPEGAAEKVEARSSIHNLINSSLISRNQLLEAGALIAQYIDLERLLKIADGAPKVNTELMQFPTERTCRIAVAEDAAFGLTFQNNLQMLRLMGADLVNFSPLADYKLPKMCSGIYLPSGYIDLYARDLAKNVKLISDIQQFVGRGGCVYAEGNAVSFLCKNITLSTGESIYGAGIIGGTAVFIDPPRESITSKYCQVQTIRRSLLGESGQLIRGVREPRMIVRLEASFDKTYKIIDREFLDDEQPIPVFEGLSASPRVLASIVQTHWGSSLSAGKSFVEIASQLAQNL